MKQKDSLQQQINYEYCLCDTLKLNLTPVSLMEISEFKRLAMLLELVSLYLRMRNPR